MQLDQLGIGVIRIASRLEDLAEYPLLPRLGQDLAGRQVIAGERDPDADLVPRHDELRADLPRPDVWVVEVPPLGQHAVIGPARLDALVVGPAILGRRGQLHLGLELQSLQADQHGLLAGAHLDLARVVQGHHQPQPHQEEAADGHRGPGPGRGRPRPTRSPPLLIVQVHERLPERTCDFRPVVIREIIAVSSSLLFAYSQGGRDRRIASGSFVGRPEGAETDGSQAIREGSECPRRGLRTPYRMVSQLDFGPFKEFVNGPVDLATADLSSAPAPVEGDPFGRTARRSAAHAAGAKAARITACNGRGRFRNASV